MNNIPVREKGVPKEKGRQKKNDTSKQTQTRGSSAYRGGIRRIPRAVPATLAIAPGYKSYTYGRKGQYVFQYCV
ncbi:MAG TPA: hypothetical protein VN949_01265 [Candidatus Limnocylindrales bacterium]|nr:hypothetical protein [Candidatus Limnocylindrales bacterium]